MENKHSELSKPVDSLKAPTLIAARNFERWSKLAALTSESSGVLHSTTLLETSQLLSALLAELEAKDKRIAELESSVIAPGIMRCAKCEFVLTKNNLNLAAGTITAGDSKTEPCPNGCGPLWSVTWREQAIQSRDDSEQWFEELQAAKSRVSELEVKLATPVRLPKVTTSLGYGDYFDGVDNGKNSQRESDAEAVRAAGFTVGDE